MPKQLDAGDKDFEAAFAAFVDTRRDQGADVTGAVAAIIDAVKAEGDKAVIAYTQEFDGLTLTPETLRVPDTDMAAAQDQCDPDAMEALKMAAGRIEDFHARQKPEDLDYVDEAGLRLGQRWTPIAAVGLYVPGGTAAYPSSVLMNALPAKVAGVERVVMVVPAPDEPVTSLAASCSCREPIFSCICWACFIIWPRFFMCRLSVLG